MLARREEFIKSIDLENTVLFSARYRLELLEKEIETIKKFNPSKEALELLERDRAILKRQVENEIIIPIEVDADKFEEVKKDLFPSLTGHVTGSMYVAMMGGTTKAQIPKEGELFFDDTHKWVYSKPGRFLTEQQREAAVAAVFEIMRPFQPTPEMQLAELQAAKKARESLPPVNPEFANDPVAARLGKTRAKQQARTPITEEKLQKLFQETSQSQLVVIDMNLIEEQLAARQSELGLTDDQVEYALYFARELRDKNRNAVKQLGRAYLNRELKLGDIRPELRLAGLVPSTHPLVAQNHSVHFAGNFVNMFEVNLQALSPHLDAIASRIADPQKKQRFIDTFKKWEESFQKLDKSSTAAIEKFRAEVKSTLTQLQADGSLEGLPIRLDDTLEFATREFNAPTTWRFPTKAQEKHPLLKETMQKATVSFAKHEQDNPLHPSHPLELLIDMKLWRLFNAIYPNLKDLESRKWFMEMYDISPGERTLEWTQSFPPPAHTFVETPIIKEAEEPAEDGSYQPVQWPRIQLPSALYTGNLELKEGDRHHPDVIRVTNLRPRVVDEKAALPGSGQPALA